MNSSRQRFRLNDIEYLYIKMYYYSILLYWSGFMMIRYLKRLPDKAGLYRLFQTTGWPNLRQLDEGRLYLAASGSWYFVSAWAAEECIGFGRVISDGAFQAFICDLIVHPDYQSRGIGSTILQSLLAECQRLNLVSVQLSAAKGKAGFYRKFGFAERLPDAPGMYWADRSMLLH
ncbi:Acetyltransferase (GNAT) family protein [compost metagenome]